MLWDVLLNKYLVNASVKMCSLLWKNLEKCAENLFFILLLEQREAMDGNVLIIKKRGVVCGSGEV